jgi:UDP-N-acetylglucosamine/UDP-N-acetylgalactosamine diphosphorylase
MAAASSSPTTLAALAAKGVTVLNPESVFIADDVILERISGDGVVIYPGTRIIGSRTVIGPGSVIGAEGTATLDDCALGARVQFKGGYATRSVFLDDVTVGLGAQIREACLLEEQSSVAHNVGLKHTILFPFATLGSQINFCDALLAGGTSRKDHSEVGSGFVHFNFTPRGDKATASAFGDVARGVWLREQRIFLGGNGGAVGPVRVGFGVVSGAGVILRDDAPDDSIFAYEQPLPQNRDPKLDGTFRRNVSRQIAYLAGLRTLKVWYELIRKPYFQADGELGVALYEAASTLIDTTIAERKTRLKDLAMRTRPTTEGRRQLAANIDAVLDAITTTHVPEHPDVISATTISAGKKSYLDAIQSLPYVLVPQGEAWLNAVVGDVCRAAVKPIPALDVHPWHGLIAASSAKVGLVVKTKASATTHRTQ